MAVHNPSTYERGLLRREREQQEAAAQAERKVAEARRRKAAEWARSHKK